MDIDCVEQYLDCFWFSEKTTRQCAEELEICFKKHPEQKELYRPDV